MISKGIKEFILCQEPKICNHVGWFKNGRVRIYLRFGFRYLDVTRRRLCLDLGSVTVTERNRGKRHFTRFMDALEDFLDKHRPVPVYVECVVEPRLYGFFRKRGYKKLKLDMDVCFLREANIKGGEVAKKDFCRPDPPKMV